MKKKSKIGFAIAGVIVLAAVIAANLVFEPHEATAVELHTIERKDLSQVVSASGRIQPKRTVDVATEVSGKVVKVAVEEGDAVEKGQLLLQIDPKPLLAQVQQLEASCESSRANIDLTQANLAQARKDLARIQALYEDELESLDNLQKATTALHVEEARLRSARQELLRLQASLDEARHQLSKVDIHSDIDGTVIAVNIEQGETAFVGAFNNPATVLLTVADLTEIEAVVEVDETEAVKVAIDQKVEIEIDAHPDWIYRGRVTEVGHSPVLRSAGGEREGTAFEVRIAVLDDIPQVRPGLTCSAEIQTAYRPNAVALPIQALTLRKPGEDEEPEAAEPEGEAGITIQVSTGEEETGRASSDGASSGGAGARKKDSEPEDPDRFSDDVTGPRLRRDLEGKVEGVFVVEDGKAHFRPVTIGITGEKDHEVLEGLAEGEVVVIGPFKALRGLEDGDEVKAEEEEKDDSAS